MKVVKYDNTFYQVFSTKNSCLKLQPLKVETLEKVAKNELLGQFSREDLMQEFINRSDKPKDKVIIEELEGGITDA